MSSPPEYDEELRRTVFSMAERFVPVADMVVLIEFGRGLKLTVEQLEDDFARELSAGTSKGRLAISDGLQRELAKGNAAVMIYLSKVHLGWSEKKPKPPQRSTTTPPTTPPDERTELATILNFRDRLSRKS